MKYLTYTNIQNIRTYDREPRQLEKQMIFFNAIKYHVHWNIGGVAELYFVYAHMHTHLPLFRSSILIVRSVIRHRSNV